MDRRTTSPEQQLRRRRLSLTQFAWGACITGPSSRTRPGGVAVHIRKRTAKSAKSASTKKSQHRVKPSALGNTDVKGQKMVEGYQYSAHRLREPLSEQSPMRQTPHRGRRATSHASTHTRRDRGTQDYRERRRGCQPTRVQLPTHTHTHTQETAHGDKHQAQCLTPPPVGAGYRPFQAFTRLGHRGPQGAAHRHSAKIGEGGGASSGLHHSARQDPT